MHTLNSWREIGDTLTIVMDFGEPMSINNTNNNYHKTIDILDRIENDFHMNDDGFLIDETTYDSLVKLFSPKVAVEKFFHGTDLRITENEIYYKNEPITGYLVDLILNMLDDGQNVVPLINFLTKLQQNPLSGIRDQLYKFLEYGKNAITPDGCFLAYKYVNSELYSCHRGMYDVHGQYYPNERYRHFIGDEPAMPRERCDNDPARTCSKGLHVCSRQYLGSAPTSGGTRIVVCKVDPADVVAVPNDYQNTKMRTCRYKVVAELSPEQVSDDILSTNSVNDDYDNFSRSSFIDDVYSTENYLYVDFTNGSTYCYQDVPKTISEDFINNDNWSDYFHEFIKNRYQFQKL